MLKLKTNFLKYKDENGDMQDSGMLFAQNETDSTLTKSGVAADAQVVGEKLVTLSEQKVNKSGLTLDIHTDGLIYLFVDGKPTGNGFEVGTGTIVEGDVTGVLDENNNILLSGDLENGEYVLKWLDKDGNYVDAGTIVVGAVPEPEPVKTNFFNIGGNGYILNGRCGSDGSDRRGANQNPYGCLSNYFDIANGDTIYVMNATIPALFSGMKFADNTTTGYMPAESELVTNYSVSDGTTQFTINSETADYTRLCLSVDSSFTKENPATAEDIENANIIINIKRNGEWL